MRKQTPWGEADGAEILAEGIISYSTPSHGGIWLSEERRELMPKETIAANFLKDRRGFTAGAWWEEDCDWAMPYVVFANDIQSYGKAYHFTENLTSALEIANMYHPSIFSLS